MKCTGITAEYNPFHQGHAYHIKKTRELLPENFIAAVMSGSFVQRGDIAIFNKHSRAKEALENGADIVFELPVIFSLACAQRFAQGAITLFEHSSIVSHISFGSESADTERLTAAANASINETDNSKEKLKEILKSGVSFAKAQSEAFALCNAPNDVLGTEYIKAIKSISSSITPIAIKRIGAMHDSDKLSENGFYSASKLRNLILSDEYPTTETPVSASTSEFSAAILFKLRSMSKEKIALLPDVSEGLENVIYSACREASSYEDFLTLAKSKRYTLSRLRRIAFCALLSITNEMQFKALQSPEDYLFLRILGIKRSALPLLGTLAKESRIPIITTYADTQKLSKNAKAVLDLNIHADEVYNVFAKKSAVSDYTRPLLIV